MNREIKFRAFNPTTKDMLYSDEAPKEPSRLGNFFYGISLAPDSIVMQYTGLKDKNGNGVWEGDIVKAAFMHHGKPGTPFTAFIFYNEHIGAFRIGYDSLGGGSQDEIYFRYQIEVIGNIYENPNLIKI